MQLTKEQIEAFLRGESVSTEIVEQIRLDLKDPHSEVAASARRSSELTRIAFDPEGPLFADLGTPIQSRFGQLLVEQGLTIEDVVQRTRQAGHELEGSFLKAIEAGRQSVDPIVANKLAPALGISVSQMLRRETALSPVQLLGESKRSVSRTSPAPHITASVRQDLVRELSDFLTSETAERMTAAWADSPTTLNKYVASFAENCDEFDATLVAALAVTCLRKDHAVGNELTLKLLTLAQENLDRRLIAEYLCGRHAWYTNVLDRAALHLENARQLAVTLADDRRLAQALLYLARIAIVSPPTVQESAERLVEQSRTIARRIGRADIELLAMRAEMIRLRVAKDRGKVIPLARRILDPAERWVHLGFDSILDSVRVDLALSLRSQFTEAARQEAERLYQAGVERGRDDSHAAMCLYLTSDLYVDRLLECLREVAEQRNPGDEVTKLLATAESYRATAHALCERSRDMLKGRGDLAALQKVNRRFAFLQSDGFTIPANAEDALSDYAVTMHQVSEKFLGLNLSAAGQPFAAGVTPLARQDLEILLRVYFAGVFVRLDSTAPVSPPACELAHFLRPDSVLCIPWPVGDSLVVRFFGIRVDGATIENLGWFIIANYVTGIRPALSDLLDLDGDTFVSLRHEYFNAIQERVATIDALTRRETRHVAVLAPVANADWMCPIEWLTTSSDAAGPGVALLDVAQATISYATSPRSAFDSLGSIVVSEEFVVYATSQPLRTGGTLHGVVSRELGMRVWPFDSIEDGHRAVSGGLMLFAHADGQQDFDGLLAAVDLANCRAFVLLFCASTHYMWSQGPFVDGLALRIRNRLPSDAVLVGSRVPVTIDEALRLAKELLADHDRDLSVAEQVTRYIQRSRRYGGTDPYAVPWVVMT